MADHDIGLVFIDEDDRTYLSIPGRASVTRDTAKAKEIWKKTDDIWLQGGPCACFAWSRSLSLEGQRIELRNVVADIPTMDIGLAWNRLRPQIPATKSFHDFLSLSFGGASGPA